MQRQAIGTAVAGLCLAAGAFVIPGLQADAVVSSGVVISEIMVNPFRVFDSRGEWIEVLNAGPDAIDLGGWTIGDEFGERVVLPPMMVSSGGYVTLARHLDAFLNGGVQPNFVYGSSIELNETADRLVLRDAAGHERDRVDWSGFTVPDGASLSLTDPSVDGADPASWCASVSVMRRGDLGTPGRANRCEASASHLVITEIMQNPASVADERGEFFEVYNAGDAPVDMSGFTIKDDDLDSFVVSASVLVAARGYAVLATDDTGNGGLTPAYVYGRSMELQNDTDELVIADRDLVQVDRVRWDNGLTFPQPNGASMSLVDPLADNSVGRSWCASSLPWATGDRGTPGSASWCLLPGQSPIVITEVLFDPETPASERSSEWFEVLNLGPTPIDLDGWTIIGGDYESHTITSLVVPAGRHVVLASTDDRSLNGDVAADYVYGTGVPLYNTSGRLVLESPVGYIVDRVDWSVAAGFPIPSGRSISIGRPTADNSLGANWCASTTTFGAGDFGSPGSASVCESPLPAPALVISEVMRNPAVVADSVGEWFEVHNTTDAPIDLWNWVLEDGASDRHVVREHLVVPAQASLVLGRSTDPAVNGGTTIAYSYGSGFVLSNADDRITVIDRYGQHVDTVQWQQTDVLRPNGASTALVGGGWCESGPQFGFGDRGTPGTANDCTPLPHEQVVINEVQLDPTAVSDDVGEWFEL